MENAMKEQQAKQQSETDDKAKSTDAESEATKAEPKKEETTK